MPNLSTANAINQDLAQRGYGIRTGFSIGTFPSGHQHKGFEILYLHSGSSEMIIGQNRFTLSGGQAVFLHGGASHCARSVSNDYTRTALHFQPDISSTRYSDFLDSIVQNGGALYTLRTDSANRFLWTTNELLSLSTSAHYPHHVVVSLVDLILAELRDSDIQAPAPPAIIRDIIDYMQNHATNIDDLQQLYNTFFYSPSHIRQLFKEHLGCTPQHYLLQLKATKACELLRSSASINQVAQEAGFANVRSFQRSFKRILGVTPSEYRNGLQNREFINNSSPVHAKFSH
jgi:AraC-like DNA-binding protein/quercetin dioxygenase-like cupin family protein